MAVYAVFDLIATPSWRVRFLPKPFWFVVIIPPIIGPLLWVFFGSHGEPSHSNNGRGPDKPQSSGPIGPDDDPDFLRGL